MHEPGFREVEAWRDFYIFAGTAAATLMGLMFVVMSLGSETLNSDEGKKAMRGFFTPIIAFFATAILMAMLVLIPGATPQALGILITVVAAIGIAYMGASGAHALWRSSDLGIDDWIWYVALPFLSYLVICAAGIFIWLGLTFGLYVAAISVILLLVTGIRNAWDLVVYTVQHQRRGS